MMTPAITDKMRCPTCEEGGLEAGETATTVGNRFERGELRCDSCEITYPIEGGVPVLLPREALHADAWKLWRDHLAKFQARREDRISKPERVVTRLASASRPQRSFADFTGIEEGTVLDVGCGPGKFRLNFDGEAVQYIGIDPIALPEAQDFPLIRGVAEFIPFKDGTFTDVVVLAALDHFRDVNRFFDEALRVLVPSGRLHLLQSVHEVRGPISIAKYLGHKVKDSLEERSMHAQDRNVPKHLAEFTSRSLLRQVEGRFEPERVMRYSARWYSPTKLFLTLKSKASAARRRAV